MEIVLCSAFESVADVPLKNKTFSQNYTDGLEKCPEGFMKRIYLVWSTAHLNICLTEKSVLLSESYTFLYSVNNTQAVT